MVKLYFDENALFQIHQLEMVMGMVVDLDRLPDLVVVFRKIIHGMVYFESIDFVEFC